MRSFNLAMRALRTNFVRANLFPGQRDFIWLSLFIAVLVAALGINNAAFRGLEDSLRKTLLGATPEHGIGLRVQMPEDFKGLRFDWDLHDRLKNLPPARQDSDDQTHAAYNFYPWYPIDMQSGRIGLPRQPRRQLEGSVWRSGGMSGTESAARFAGIAISLKDPLWAAAQERSSEPNWRPAGALPLTMIIAESSAKHIDFEIYGDILRAYLPKALHDTIPADIQQLLASDTFYILVQQGASLTDNHILAAEVLWVDSIPGPDQVQFLFPLETYTAIRQWTADCPNDLNDRRVTSGIYYPEAHGNSADRALSIKIPRRVWRSMKDPTKRQDKVQAFMACTGSVVDARPGRRAPSFEVIGNLDFDIAQACLGDFLGGQKPDSIDLKKTSSLAFTVDSQRIVNRTPMAADHCAARIAGTVEVGNEAGDGVVYIGPGASVPAARTALLQFQSRTLEDGKERLKQQFSFAPSYRRTLSRFTVLESMLQSTILPLLVLFAIIGLALMLVQLLVTLSHRRTTFGLLLADGASIWFARLFFLWQLGTAALAALPLALGLQWAGTLAFNAFYRGYGAAETVAANELGVSVPELALPVAWLWTAGIWGIVLLSCTAISLSIGTLGILTTRRRSAPIDYL